MILTNLHITNYKCILDSNGFPINRLTCLVGKNESGKSAVLQALYKLNPVDEKEQFNALFEYPKMYQADYDAGELEDGDDIITSSWIFSEEEKTLINNKYGDKFLERVDVITITRGYRAQREWSADFNFEALFQHKMAEFEFEDSDYESFPDLTSISAVRKNISSIGTPTAKENLFIGWFKTAFVNDSITTFSEKELVGFLPKFMYFSEYQKMPGRIAINDFNSRSSNSKLTSNEKVFEALLSLAGTNISQLNDSTKLEELINKTRGVSSKITREIFAYWSQNKHLRVEFRCDMAKPGDEPPFNQGYIFSTRIENTRHDSTVSFDERSAGFVWFFSFLIWFYELQKKHTNIIVLLDEPGLTLHAKAQADLLRYIKEKIIPKFQVVYTTHSPFMVDFSDIFSVRTVEDATDENDHVLGTKIGSDVLSTDKDTIFPLQAAFGYDITQTLFIGKNTLLVEGPSDIIYLSYFSNLLAKSKRESLDKRWTICPSGGIDKIQSFVSLFGGNSLNIASLTDYHDGDKKKIERLRETNILKTGHILLASDYTGLGTSDIEDIIGTSEYIHLVNQCYGLKGKDLIKETSDIDGKVLKYVEEKMALVKADIPNFDHYAPSEYLIRTPNVFDGMEIAETLNRFESLFKDINAML